MLLLPDGLVRPLGPAGDETGDGGRGVAGAAGADDGAYDGPPEPCGTMLNPVTLASPRPASATSTIAARAGIRFRRNRPARARARVRVRRGTPGVGGHASAIVLSGGSARRPGGGLPAPV